MKKISIRNLEKSVTSMLAEDWALLTAAKKDGTFNTMTVSWGCSGFLWNKEVFQCYVRPQRFTHEFTEDSDYITLSFFDASYRDKLQYCGKNSGRDVDKTSECGLTPVKTDKGVYLKEASTVFTGRKIYTDKFKGECFVNENPAQWYKDDYHTLYICEIIDVFIKE